MTHGTRQSKKKQRAKTPIVYIPFDPHTSLVKPSINMLPLCSRDNCYSNVYRKCVNCHKSLCMFHFSHSNSPNKQQDVNDEENYCIKCRIKYGLVV
ncbi:MAG: hypothetical protein L0H55_00920 [Candidatus Nitrosocosmicus sp.]|nr:hypothetical protein [Candidatus Nitrosocosmicus sp.]